MDTAFEELVELTHIDPWFLTELKELADMTRELSEHTLDTLPPDLLREAKRYGFSDARIARLVQARPADVAAKRGDQRNLPGLQARRYLRRGIRVLHAVPVFDLRRGRRGRADRRTRRSSFWEAVRTGSGRESSSITAAAMPRLR